MTARAKSLSIHFGPAHRGLLDRVDKIAAAAGEGRTDVARYALELGVSHIEDYPGGLKALQAERAKEESLRKALPADLVKRLSGPHSPDADFERRYTS